MLKILCFVLGLVCFNVSFADGKQFDTMVIFGDSLSDNGNLYNFMWHTLPVSPPYYLGHFSNGELWAEQLYRSYFPTDYVTGFQNYAVGGAGAVLSYKQYLPYTLTMELNNYFYWHTYGKKDTTLYALWIGGNNYLNAPYNEESITESVVNAIGGAIERLIKGGGTKFLIANLPDLAKTPYAKESKKQDLFSRLTRLHNDKLAKKINDLRTQYPEITLVYFDVYSFFNKGLEQASDWGFTHISEPCYLGGYIGWLTKQEPSEQKLKDFYSQKDPNFQTMDWALIKNNPQLKEAATASYLYQLLPAKNQEEALHCEEYVFWDRIHPSTKAHTYIAEQARVLLDEAGLRAFVPTT